MSWFHPTKLTQIDIKQNRLIQLAAAFLFLFSIALTLAPAARLHSWNVSYRWNHWIGFAAWMISTAFTHRQLMRYAPDRDPYLFPIIALLSGWGLLTIWRLDSGMGTRQTIWLVICMLALAGSLRISEFLHLLRRYKYLWLTSGLLLTGLTFLFGTYPGGSGPRLWLGCCGVYLQPSEPLKLLLIIYLAAYLADRLPISFNIPQLITPTLILIAAALALLAIQRDLGTASLFVLIYSVVLFIASNHKRLLLGSLVVLLIAGIVGYLLFDVVRIRVDAWINPWLDPSGRSYQIVQSLISVSAGGIFGRGPGLGSPGVVPVSHSDFIFAAVAEETGLIGTLALLSLFILLVGRGFRASIHAASNYQRYLAAGVSAYLAMQAIFIIGGNLRLLPLTGVTLPFVSYGGSSLLTSFIACLILILISNRSEEEPAPLTQSSSYLLVSSVLMAGILALALADGWWSIIRSDALLTRTDNPRRGITDRYVSRGNLLDRNNKPIISTTGQPGSYTRSYNYPPLGPVTGYNSSLYGQAGLEAGLDPYLRGLKGNPTSLIWMDYLLYGQSPPGLDVRLSLDLELQQKADTLLGDHAGAVVLLDANTGEILAMASHPYYDPNQLDTTWLDLTQSAGSPLLNRATLGHYPPGTALGPFLLAYANVHSTQVTIPSDLSVIQAEPKKCAVQPLESPTLGNWVASGCPDASTALGQEIGVENLDRLFESLGFYQAPELPLEVAQAARQPITDANLAATGQTMKVTPLQMAVAAAALTNQGSLPVAQVTLAVLSHSEGWLLFPLQAGRETVIANGVEKTLLELDGNNPQKWETTSIALEGTTPLTWYIGGGLPQARGKSLAIAVILEESNPQLAQDIGQSLLATTQGK